MKSLLLFSAVFMAIISFGQGGASTPSHSLSARQTEKLDSFSFCRIVFKVPSDCRSGAERDCCRFTTEPDQVGCYDGTTLSWDYFTDEKIARMHHGFLLAQWGKEMKDFKKELVRCILVDQPVAGHRIRFRTAEGADQHYLVAYGTVNGQSVLLMLLTKSETLSNQSIQPAIRQVFRLAE